MATVTPTSTTKRGYTVVKWAGVVTADTLVAHECISRPDLVTLQMTGTFANGTVAGMSGSMGGTTFTPCNDMTQTAIAATAVDVLGVLEACPHYKPTIASGSSDAVDYELAYWTR